MAAFTNSGAGTLKSVILESAILELAYALQVAETAAIAAARITDNNISISLDSEASTASITFQVPLTTTLSAGKLVLAADDYVSKPGFEATFNPGNTGLESTTLVGAFWEIVSKASFLETDVNNIGISADVDNKIGSASINLPVAFAVAADGALKVTANSYLP